jgi:hypothetical protein
MDTKMKGLLNQKYTDILDRMQDPSNETIAILVLAGEISELTKAVNMKTTIIDGEQISIIRKSIDELSQTLHGVGQMVDKLQ